MNRKDNNNVLKDLILELNNADAEDYLIDKIGNSKQISLADYKDIFESYNLNAFTLKNLEFEALIKKLNKTYHNVCDRALKHYKQYKTYSNIDMNEDWRPSSNVVKNIMAQLKFIIYIEALREAQNIGIDDFVEPRRYSIDRINNNGDYTYNNLRWAKCSDQIKNRSNSINLKIVFNDKVYKTYSLHEISRFTGIPYPTLYKEIKEGKTDLSSILSTKLI